MTDDNLRDLLHDAVSDVHPDPALAEIRRRTRTSASSRRTGPWLVVPAAAATVAVIAGGIALLNQPDRAPAQVGGPAGSTSAPATVSPVPAGPGPVERALAVYYVGDTPQGPRLYREFQRVLVAPYGPSVSEAVSQALQPPDDPDYRTAWPTGTRVDRDQVSPGGEVTVSLTNASADLRKRPAGVSDAEATAGVQQLVYTVQAAAKNRNPVRIQLDDTFTDTLLGVDVSAPVPSLSQLSILSLVSIADPAEGAVVRGSFVAGGVASSFEANVPWQLTKDGTVVKKGFSTAAGWMDRLYPWQTDPIDVSGIAPGSYTFVAMTDDPSSGEGGGPQQDTRTIVVRR
ncbi:MAG: Gmad2 immunoglobulin-like domain-containing protein [Marmoricola sp.]